MHVIRGCGRRAMPEEFPTYDLMLLLSKEASDEQRSRILSEVQSAISGADGSIARQDDWGTRALSFRISHEAEADYHLLQFSGPPSLLESLSHSLRIADGVLRFRIIKLLPGMRPAPDSAPPVIAPVTQAAAGTGARESSGGARDETSGAREASDGGREAAGGDGEASSAEREAPTAPEGTEAESDTGEAADTGDTADPAPTPTADGTEAAEAAPVEDPEPAS